MNPRARWSIALGAALIGALSPLCSAASLCQPGWNSVMMRESGGASIETGFASYSWQGSALKITFKPGGQWSGVKQVYSSPQDWSAFGGLAGMRITNLDSETMHLDIRIDQQGASPFKSAFILIPPGATWDISQPLQILSGWSPPYHGQPMNSGTVQIDLTKVIAYRFSTFGPNRDRSILVEDVCLLPPLTQDGAVDRYGQYSAESWTNKITSDAQLQQLHQQEAASWLPAPSDRDQYGGWLNGPQLTVTGYFRAAKHNGRWWLVTPTGHLFFALGMGAWNMYEGTPIGAEGSPRRRLFTWIPDASDPLNIFKGTAQGIGEFFCFYAANIHRTYGAANHIASWRDTVFRRMASWGFNTGGDASMVNDRRAPIALIIDVGGYGNSANAGQIIHPEVPHFSFDGVAVPDVFHVGYATHALARMTGEMRPTEPWVLGYYVDNEIWWGRPGTHQLVRGAFNQTSAVVAKQRFIEWLQGRYGTIAALNQAWGTAFPSWTDLLNNPATLPSPPNAALDKDLGDLLAYYADKYFNVVSTTFRQVDSNHLYMGTRFPGTGVAREAIDAGARYSDVATFNIYKYAREADELAAFNYDKPVMVTEFSFGSPGRGLYSGLVGTDGQAARAQAYIDFVEDFSSDPHVVGLVWFKYFDQPLTGSFAGQSYNQGLLDNADIPYPELVTAVSGINRRIYDLLSGGAAPPAAPSNLAALAVSSHQINLSWSDNSSDETSFGLDRSSVGATTGFLSIATLPANATFYADGGLLSYTTYWYRVNASNNAGASAHSNVASTRTLRLQSLLYNGDLEQTPYQAPPVGWALWAGANNTNNGDYRLDAVNPHSGQYSYRILRPGTSGYTVTDPARAIQPQPNMKYTVSFWARSSTNTAKFGVIAYESFAPYTSAPPPLQTTTINVGPQWQFYSFTIYEGWDFFYDHSRYLMLMFSNTVPNQTLWVDDVSVVAQPSDRQGRLINEYRVTHAPLDHRLQPGGALDVTVDAAVRMRAPTKDARGVSFHRVSGYLQQPYLFHQYGGTYSLQPQQENQIRALNLPMTRFYGLAEEGYGLESSIDKAHNVLSILGIPEDRTVLEFETQAATSSTHLLPVQRWVDGVRHSMTRGYRFKHWEIGNEPEFSPAIYPTPDHFAAQFSSVSQAVRAVQADAQVGMVVEFHRPANRDWGNYIIYKTAGKYDWVAGHLYNFGSAARGFEQNVLTDNYHRLDSALRINALLRAYNPGREIYQYDTEWGSPTAECDYAGGCGDDYASRTGNIWGMLHSAVRLIYMSREDILRGASAWNLISRYAAPGTGFIEDRAPYRLSMRYHLFEHFSRHLGDWVVDIRGNAPFYTPPSDYDTEYVGPHTLFAGPYTPTLATVTDDGRTMYLIIANGSRAQTFPGQISLANFNASTATAVVLSDFRPNPDTQHPYVDSSSQVIRNLPVSLAAGALSFSLPPYSVAFITVGGAAPWDPSVLGVAWADHFNPIVGNEIDVMTDARLSVKAKGDGVTDDFAALQQAVNLAAATGGGVVYLPAGDYKIVAQSGASGNPLKIPSRVVLRGQSRQASRIIVHNANSGAETDDTRTWGGISLNGSSLVGLTDLSISLVNPSPAPGAVLWNRTASQATAEVFLHNLDVRLANGRNVWINHSSNVLVKNSSIDTTSGKNGAIMVFDNDDVTFVGNTVTYNYGRVQMHALTRALIQGNTFYRDSKFKHMRDGVTPESGGIELTFGADIQLINNVFQTTNTITNNLPSDQLLDGETIMTQHSNYRDMVDVGTVTAAGAASITDAGALWGSDTVNRMAAFSGYYVAPISGNATGSWRYVTSLNAASKTITVDPPWDPVPAVGSLFTLGRWSAKNLTIKGNILIDNPRGIEIYNGCVGCVIENNTLYDSRGIYIRAADNDPDAMAGWISPESRHYHDVAINNRVIGNTFWNTKGLKYAYAMMDVESFGQAYRGMAFYDAHVASNTLHLYPASPSKRYYFDHYPTQEDFYPCYMYPPGRGDPVTVAIQKLHFWGNTQDFSFTLDAENQPYATRACATLSPPSTAPAAPGNLAAVAASSAQINLSWTDHSSNETGFDLERSSTGPTSGYVLAANIGANMTAYSNSGLQPATTYWYRVRAVNGAGSSGYSNVASAVTSPAPPPPPPPQGFEYVDDVYQDTNLPLFAAGDVVTSPHCPTGRSTCYRVGLSTSPAMPGSCSGNGCSGGWRTSVVVPQLSRVTISFSYTLQLSGSNRRRQDARLYYRDPATGQAVLATQLLGRNGNNNSALWTTSGTITNVYLLEPGSYPFDVGCWHNDDAPSKFAACYVDDVKIELPLDKETKMPEPPKVSVTAQSPLTTGFSKTIRLTAHASDEDGIAGVQLQVDGVNVGHELAIRPYAAILDLSDFEPGVYEVAAVARSYSGASNRAITVVTIDPAAPAEFDGAILKSYAYPSPARRRATIRLELTSPARGASANAYTLSGERVATIAFEQARLEGDIWIMEGTWNLDGVPSGVYSIVTRVDGDKTSNASRIKLGVVK